VGRSRLIRYTVLTALFAAGIVAGLLLWEGIELPFQNPWGVKGRLTEIQYNPANDVLRFAVFVSLPVFLLAAVYLAGGRRIRDVLFPGDRGPSAGDSPPDLPPVCRVLLPVILVTCSVVAALNIPTFHASGRFDSFHEGETLGPAVSYMAGETPYRDFIFLHGLYENPLRSVTAFRLFGRSIASVRTLESIMKILAFVSLSLLMLVLFRGRYLYSFTALALLAFLHLSGNFNLPRLMLVKTRDITVFLFLTTVVLLRDAGRSGDRRLKRVFVTGFFFSFIPLIAFMYTVDRGVFLFASYMIIFPLMYLLYFSRADTRGCFLWSSSLGLFSAAALAALLIGDGLPEFVRYAFLTMPRYRELMSGYVYPVFNKLFLAAVVLIAANAFWVASRFLRELHLGGGSFRSSAGSFMEKYLVEFSMLLLSVFLFRTALGRSDWPHVAYSLPVTYILSACIVLKHHSGILRPRRFRSMYGYLLAALVTLTLFLGTYRIYGDGLLRENFPLGVEDSAIIPDNYKATISFLKENLSPDESFFTMTAEASWYYFIDRPSPCRFPVIIFAMPYFYQDEVVRDLERRNVKFVLYRNSNWSNRIDGFPNEERLQIIAGYIRDRFEFYRKIDDNEIWIRKGQVQDSEKIDDSEIWIGKAEKGG